jgi:3-methyl-2-oxobutanoate hydroxymethyltransferase
MLSQGYRVQGKTKDSAKKLIESAKALEEAGVFSITLEMITSEVAKIISESVSVPTIGIGSGKNCDGQVLVIHDMLGMYDKLKPKFVKRYLSLSKEITKAVELYKKDVESGRFPGKENWFSMEKSELDALREEIG